MMENRVFMVEKNLYFYPEKKLLFTTSRKVEQEAVVSDFAHFETKYVAKTPVKGLETDLTILLTSACNLRCVYCYSKAGDVPVINVPKDAVYRNIQRVIRNAALLSKSDSTRHVKATIKFTGGGEPTCAWNQLVEYVNYIFSIGEQERRLFELTIQTNGQLADEDKIDYICTHFDEVIVSCDGYEEMQDTTRPRADGKSSWECLSKFIERLDYCKVNYALRTTVTNNNIDRLYDICEYYFNRYHNLSFVHFEPLGHGGRGENLDMIDMGKFAKILLELNYKYAGRVGTSTVPYRMKNGCYCDSQTGYSLVVNTVGDIVSCVEKANDANCDDDWITQKYVVGGYNKNENYEQKSRIGKECNSCYALPFCFGGCPLRIVRDDKGNKITEYGKEFCKLEHEIVKAFMKGALVNNELVDYGLPDYVTRCVSFPLNSNIR